MKQLAALSLAAIAVACGPTMPALYGPPPAPPAQWAPPPAPPSSAAAQPSPAVASSAPAANPAASAAAASASQQMADQRTQAGAVATDTESTSALVATFNLSIGAAKADSAPDNLAGEQVPGTAYIADATRFAAVIQSLSDGGNQVKAAELAAIAKPLMDQATVAIGRENACRADAACTNDRSRMQICQVIAARKGTAAQIALEKKNPSGVVDLEELHNLGATVQHLDDQIAELKSSYRSTVKKSFDVKSCASAPATPSQ